jgi:hypothetical protein
MTPKELSNWRKAVENAGFITEQLISGTRLMDFITTIESLQSELSDSQKENESLRVGTLNQHRELTYIDGIVLKGTGIRMELNDTYRERILNYVKHLERQLSDAYEVVIEIDRGFHTEKTFKVVLTAQKVRGG